MKSLKQSIRLSAPDVENTDPLAFDPLTAFSKQAEAAPSNSSLPPISVVLGGNDGTESLAKISADKVSPESKDMSTSSTGKFSSALSPKPLATSTEVIARSSGTPSSSTSPLP
ncbi:hypothetical protein EON64_11050, partial [archaeon]